MAFSNDTNGMVMPVSPMYGGGYGSFGGFGGDGWWLILLLLCGWGGGFGGGFGGWGGMMGMGMMDGLGLYPWLNNSQNINGGFRDQATQTQLGNLQNSVTSGFGDVQVGLAGVNQNICQTGNGIVAALNGAQNAITQQMYGNQIADMERSYNSQTAIQQGMNNIAMNQQNCCCENRAGLADLKYTVAAENCADRTQSMQNTRDIIESQNRTGQAILDKLCQLELDGERAKNEANLREITRLNSELMYARGQASQVEQTAALRASQATTANQLVSELRSCPIPSQPVYGNQPIFTCSGPQWNNQGCGCGCNG